ncbi:VCP-like ATPase [Wickerhamomyces ciferrii]|uniref:VCP-like ATPase n=1 Tax=Wickerhamomyces ciferrii (strain ATCC 14091 / BCRC 22168 / CBS 111 / JCM 3599 / NBRC 0793 / NRRL Y-1031 F-60-10) TaxID=1206466 RepID=K0KSI3_WICCF|nr:VCP-like ATPase [Wickerhamomyces ciferrii]CCH46131.1 VCP-like ATPase [Wickerhamomyces ciferrii]
MAPKASSGSSGAPKGTPKKKSADEGDGPASKPSKTKIPRTFVVRPSPSVNHKSVAKVYLHQSILKASDITAGSLINISREGEAGVLAIANAGDEGCPLNVIQVSNALRSVSGLMFGDRLEISKVTAQPEYCDSITIGNEAGKELPKRALKAVEKVLDEVGIVMPGLRFQNFPTPGETENDEKTLENLVIVESEALPNVAKLQLEENDNPDSDNFQRFISPPLLFKRGSTKVTFSQDTEPLSKYLLPKTTTYSSVGGLSRQIELLKASIELPLHQPTLFSDFGITPPRGILLHGPPGTGKTMLLRAVAAETNAHVLTINGPSIVSKYLGETESALRDIFNEARRYQPSIIFIDEIDSLAPSRSSDDSGEVESRVVATLLTLMDGVGDSGRLVVVAATNRPNSVDSALRRPGRFDQEVEIGIPDVEARDQILKLQFEKMKRHNLSEQDVFNLASRTHGYVGADLVALCRECVMKTIRRGLKSSTPHSQLLVTLDDVETALPEIRPSAMREILLEMPKVYWSDIGGQEDLKIKLREMIQLPLEASETFKKLGVSSPKGVLLYGPPGCSKTLTAKALATESGVNFLAVKGPEIFNKYVGESERAIREIFRKARAAAPSIIFFDEIDALSPDRSEGGPTTSAGSHVLTSLLNEIDGVEELNGVVIVAATNRPDEIDPALLRPGRLDRHIYVSPPDFEARLQILKNSTTKMSLSKEDVNLEEIAEKTDGCSGAEVVLLCQEAGLAAVMENQTAEKVEKRHFEKALKSISRGITEDMLDYYRSFASKSGIDV